VGGIKIKTAPSVASVLAPLPIWLFLTAEVTKRFTEYTEIKKDNINLKIA